jgi:AraC family transcriptional regulator, transcriptional activator FtrA
MRGDIAQELPLPVLAARAGMSLRTFQRRFEEMTGKAPGGWIVQERVNRARDILEQRHDLSVDAVAGLCGFSSGESLRQHFKRYVGTTPAGYRQRFAL